jgi:transcriptional regulator with XRE-family HTH domain
MNRIREIREDKDLKQSDIAKILNVTQVAYSYYEIGKRQLPNDLLIKLAKYYNTSTDYLLGLTDERKPYPKSILINNKNN